MQSKLVFLVLLLGFSHGSSDTSCAPATSCGCIRKYVVSDIKATFYDAMISCMQQGMDLASPISEEEESALEAVYAATNPASASSNGVWIGGKKSAHWINEFTWIPTGKPLIYSKFNSGEPNNVNGIEDCVQLTFYPNFDPVYGWNDFKCNATLRFACQSRCCCSGCST